MSSPDYIAYAPSIVFVDDVSGSGGTALDAAHINGLRSDLVTYVQNHINGAGGVNHHNTADIQDGSASEALAYANVVATFYDSHARHDMAFTLLKNILGGAGNLTTRIATFLGNSGSDINSLFTALGVPTNAATASTVFKRDGTGGGQVTALGVIPPASASSIGVNVAAPSSYTGFPFAYSKSGGGSMSVGNDAKVTAPGFIGPLTGNVTGNLTGNVTGNADTATSVAALTATVLASALIADYKIVASVSAGQVTVSAGGNYGDGANGIGPLGSQAVSLPAQPTGTNVQYVAISLAPTTGAPVATGGPVSGTGLPKPTYPAGNIYLGTVTWKGATTLPSGVVAAGDIVDGRFPGGGGTSSGIDGGAPTTAQYWLNGTNGSLPDGLDGSNGATSGAFHPALVRRIVGDSSMDDIQQAWMQPDILSAARLAKSAANAVTLAASNTSPFSARNKKLVASSTAVASGATGQRYAIFDTAIPGLVTPMPATNALNPATQSQIGVYWWDNGNSVLQDGLLVDYSAVGQLPSNSVTKVTTTASNAWTDTGASGSLGVTSGDSGIVGFPVYTFYAATQCRMDFITAIGIIYSMASAGSLVISVYLDGVRVGKAWGINTSGTYTVPGPWTGRPIAISPGAHAINLAYNMVGATSTITFLAGFNEIIPTFWKG